MSLLLASGVTLILINHIVKGRQRTKIVYKYLHRDLDSYLRNEPYPSVIFKSMFEKDPQMRP